MVSRFLAAALRPFRELSAVEKLVLLAVTVLHAVAIGWGLPATDGWDVDGIAPRDFLPGLVETFTPGRYFTYPPLHLALLTVLTLPITLVALARSPSLAPNDVVTTFLSVETMTTFALVARIVACLMSLVVVIEVGRLAEAIFGRPARPWAMAACGIEVAGTYYAHTTNLDMPALFWSVIAVRRLALAVKADDPRRLRTIAVFAACAIATKDQAYAVFALSMPSVLLGWFVLRERSRRRELVRESAICLGTTVALVLVLDGAPFNPSGFAARVGFLTGPASQDFAQHSHDWAGRLSALSDAATFFPNHYPVVFAPVVVLGLFAAVRWNDRQGRLAALVPCLVIVSVTLTFNCVARRVEERFMMVQMQLAAVYLGVIGAVIERARTTGFRPLMRLAFVTGAIGILLGVRESTSLVLTMIRDARYDAERFVREHVGPGDTIEVYGGNVYLPRMPRSAAVVRVDPGPVARRNPMPGIVEQQDRLGAVEERRPRFIVVGMGYAWRYLQEERTAVVGRVLPEAQRAGLANVDTKTYVRGLFAEKLDYRLVHVSHDPGTALFPPRPMHASLATDVFVFERR